MEDVFANILKEASANKHAAIRDAVVRAQEVYSQESGAATHSLREVCITPFKLCLESKTSKLVALGITGLQNILSSEKLKCRESEIEHEDDTMPNQVVRALSVTPSLSEEQQVEVMKLLLMVAFSNSSHVSPQTVINIAKFCQSVYVQSKPEVTKACQVTIIQIMADVAQSTNNQACLEHPAIATQRQPNPVSHAAKITLSQTLRLLCQPKVKDAMIMDTGEMACLDSHHNRMCGDMVAVLGFLCNKVSETHRAGASSQNQSLLTFELDAILAMLANMEPTLRGSSAFQKVLWKELCPTLIAILGIPKDQKTIISSSTSSSSSVNQHPDAHHHPGNNHLGQEHGRGSGSAVSVPTSFRSARQVIYHIAKELVRLVGCVASMRPVIGSLLHRMLLFPPPSQRNEALKVVKDMLSTPAHILDLAGPAIEGEEITSLSGKNYKADLDLIKLLVDGISEAAHCPDVCLSSVGCVGALLASLEQISHGKGVGQWQAEEILRRAKEEKEDNDKDNDHETLPGPPCLTPESVHSQYIQENSETLDNLSLNKHLTESPEDRGTVGDATNGCRGDGLTNGMERDREEAEEEEVKEDDLHEVDPITPQGTGREDSGRADERDEEDGEGIGEDAVVDDADPVAMAAAAFAADDDHDLDPKDGDKEDNKEAAHPEQGLKDVVKNAEADGWDRTEGKDETAGNASVTSGEDTQVALEKEQSEDIPLLPQEEDCGSRREDSVTGNDDETAAKTSSPRGSPSAAAEKDAKLKAEQEREAARDFADALLDALPRFLAFDDVTDMDKAVQLFASRYVEGYTMRRSVRDGEPSGKLNLTPVINADGIYVATYSSLLLNLKLVRSNHYDDPGALPLTQKQFIDSVHYSGVLVYLSATWLGELYRIIITRNLLGEGGYRPDLSYCNGALVSILTDMDGLGSQELGGQMLHDAPTYSPGIKPLLATNTNLEGSAGAIFARQLLTTFWNRVLSVLSTPLSSRHTIGQSGGLAFLLGGEGSSSSSSGSSSKEQSSRERDAICLSLDGLRKAAELSCTLGLQTRCAAVFAQLSEVSCASDHPAPDTTTQESSSRMASLRSKLGKGHGMRLHAAHVLSMDALLSMGLEMGSHSPDCWSHVFRCCAFVSQLEHTQFSNTSTQPPVTTLPKVREPTTGIVENPEDVDDLDLLPPNYSASSSSAATPSGPQAPHSSQGRGDGEDGGGGVAINVQEIIKKEKEELGFEIGSAKGGLLSVAKAAKVVCGLSAGVDRVFDDAASNLNLQALLGFLRELCTASQAQLYRSPSQQPHQAGMAGSASGGSGAGHAHSSSNRSMIAPTSPSKSLPTVGRAETSLLLFRLGDVILKCVRHPSRPLFHLMQAWSVVAPHLIEAACHRDRHVSKRAIAILHDVLTEVMMAGQELPHFNFHEALLKPFESLLRLELCDNDVQDQVVSSICELVEGSFSNIKSGWRPLFGALRAVRMQPHQRTESDESPDRSEHPLAPVCNVFEAFLNTDNVTVFANAAIDCILCLLKFVRGGSNASMSEEGSESEEVPGSKPTSPRQRPPMTYGVFDLCFPALNYLHRCHKILASIHQMPSCPIFRGSQSIRLGARDSFPVGELSPQRSFPLPTSPTSPKPSGLAFLGISEELFEPIAMDSVDDHTGIIRVWFLLLEGLTGAVALCPRRYQPPTLELLFELLRSMSINPGPLFGVYAVTELLLPMMHCWVRRNRHVHSTWDATTANFKQACGLATDLVVEHLTGRDREDSVDGGHGPQGPDGDGQGRSTRGLCLMLKQLLDILVECIGQANESVARLGCSCIRHLLLSAGPSFSHDMWTVACNGMQRAVATSLRSVRQLMSCFQPGSDDFMGDVCPVKVAARRDVTDIEYIRLQQLAQQVFLLDTQRMATVDVAVGDEPRSYIFIIYPPEVDLTTNIDQIKSRVSFRSIVLGLLAHQLLVQTLGTILLHGSEMQVSSEHTMVTTTSLLSQSGAAETGSGDHAPPFDSALPGLLAYLSPRNLSLLLECFVQSYQIACEFNSRPGLKFLLQKVSKFEVAANLYWQGAMSFTFYLHTLLELCHHTPHEKMEASHIKGIVRELCRGQDAGDETTRGRSDSQGDVTSRGRSSTLESQNSRSSIDSVSSVDNLHLKCELTFHPRDQSDLDWLIKRLHGICNDVCATFIQLHMDPNLGKAEPSLSSDMALFFLVSPTSPETPRNRMFTFELHSDPMSDGDPNEEDVEGEDIEQELNGEPRSSKVHSSLPKAKGFKFASHWTPNVGPGAGVNGEVREHEVNVIEQRQSGKLRQQQSGEDGGSGEDGQLYTVATKKAIKSLMQEYKKRKLHHSRSVFVKKPTFKEQKYTRARSRDAALTPAERQRRKQIQEEQQSSIVRDSEAQMGTWANMLGTMLRLLQLLPEEQFVAFLPAVFPCINQLVCHVTSDQVRQGVMEFMDRVARIHGIV
ncbi:brefeldin A-inhibited guanine nucleotide-exchange protein 3-like [Diadema setosum]|uniref:brefeldin A-inhibited guanine nucleotide-exchange protein 3-like n=1 Tax=Diadema setosum TaxID=31175 RepID=UPI003B3AD7A5